MEGQDYFGGLYAARAGRVRALWPTVSRWIGQREELLLPSGPVHVSSASLTARTALSTCVRRAASAAERPLAHAGSGARRRCRPFGQWSPRHRASEPDVRVPPHPALHEHAACAGSEVPAPAPQTAQGTERRYSPANSFRPTMPRTHSTPSPCGRLSRPPWWGVTPTTTTSPPPRLGGNSGRCACPGPQPAGRRAPPGRFPRSLTHRLAGSAPSCTPRTSPRATATRHATSPARTENDWTRRPSTTTRPEHPDNPSPPVSRLLISTGASTTGIGSPTPFCLTSGPGPLAADRSSIVEGRLPPNAAPPTSVLPPSFTRPLRRPGRGPTPHPVAWRLVAQSRSDRFPAVSRATASLGAYEPEGGRALLLLARRQCCRTWPGQVPNQRARRLEPKFAFSATRAADGAWKVPVREGPDRKSMSTLPTRPSPNSM